MGIEDILSELRQQRDCLERAISALENNGRHPQTRRGRKPRRHMSADARRRIGLAMKKRWAERKKENRKAA